MSSATDPHGLERMQARTELRRRYPTEAEIYIAVAYVAEQQRRGDLAANLPKSSRDVCRIKGLSHLKEVHSAEYDTIYNGLVKAKRRAEMDRRVALSPSRLPSRVDAR